MLKVISIHVMMVEKLANVLDRMVVKVMERKYIAYERMRAKEWYEKREDGCCWLKIVKQVRF